MRVSVSNTFNDVEKARIKTWLEQMLDHPMLAAGNFPFPNRMALYIDGRAKVLRNSYWEHGDFTLNLGADPGAAEGLRLALPERLAVLSGIISVLGLWEQLADKVGAAISRILCEQYNTMMSGLVRVPAPETVVTKLAFNASRTQVAGFVGDAWYLPTGAPAEVNAEEWVIAD